MNCDNVLKPLQRSYVYFPFLCTGFIFGLMLLFYRDLDLNIRTILIPAIAVHLIGSSIICYVYHELDVINCVKARNRGEAPSPQHWFVTLVIWAVHIIWLLLLIIYLFYKDVL